MSVVYEVNYDLRGENGERREDYAILEERINLLGDAMRVEYSTWLVDASCMLPMLAAYLKKTLRPDDRLRVFAAAKVTTADGLSADQQRWMVAHGIRIWPASPFAASAVGEFEAELHRKRRSRDIALAAATAAASRRRAFVPPITSAPLRGSLAAALQPLFRPQPRPSSAWLGILGVGPPPEAH
jgi:hypothetical protein